MPNLVRTTVIRDKIALFNYEYDYLLDEKVILF